MDFESLIALRGEEEVSEVLGVSVRTLDNLRRGYVALTVDDFFELARNYPRHNLTATVNTVGERRFLAGRNRKTRNQNSRRGIALRGKRVDMNKLGKFSAQLLPLQGWVQLSKDPKSGEVFTDPIVGLVCEFDDLGSAATISPIVASLNGEGSNLRTFSVGEGQDARGCLTVEQALDYLPGVSGARGYAEAHKEPR